MHQFPNIILKPGKEQSLLRFHPWIFSGAIQKIEGEANDGEVMRVLDNRRSFLAWGHYQPGSIAVRVFSFEEAEPDQVFWTRKIQKAWDYRRQLGIAGTSETNVFRLINAEGDYIPSLVADYYNGTLVLQMHSAGIYRSLTFLIIAFREVLGDSLNAIYNKSESTLPFRAKIEKTNGFVYASEKSEDNLIITENGLKFKVNVAEGQKTGFFIDQRDNRRLLKTFSKDRDVLNMFGYTGGFSVYALAGEANKVDTVDSSASAIGLARENVEMNFGEQAAHRAIEADAFDFLKSTMNRYDLIVLDPPAFAKHNAALHNALKGYQRLNAMAIEAVRPGGVIFTFSCSQVVSRMHFRQAVFGAAAQVKRKVRILLHLNQPPDHPIDICHPEGEYLKGLVLYVE